jgi:hypothetical protein
VDGRHDFGGRAGQGEKRLFIRRRGQVSTNCHVAKHTSYTLHMHVSVSTAQRLNVRNLWYVATHVG